MLTPQGKRRAWMFLGTLTTGGAYAAAAVLLPIELGAPTALAEAGYQALIGLGCGLFGGLTVKLGFSGYHYCKNKKLDLYQEIVEAMAERKSDSNINNTQSIHRLLNLTATSSRADHALYFNALTIKFYAADSVRNSLVADQCREQAYRLVHAWRGDESEERFLKELIDQGYGYQVLPTDLFMDVTIDDEELGTLDSITQGNNNTVKGDYLHINTNTPRKK
jgi:hypothetical protein